MITETITRFAAALSITVVLAAASSCAAVYPEVRTSLRDPRIGQVLEPPPPRDLRWVAFKEANIPPLTRDGRRWGGELATNQLPDPYAILMVNGVKVLQTNVQEHTLNPTWPGSPSGNYWIRPDDVLRVELWDARVALDKPIGVSDIGTVDDAALTAGEIVTECDSGVRVRIALEPAHGKMGYGFAYEFRTHDVYVTRTYQQSPASRAGMKSGDQIVSVDGVALSSKRPGSVQSIFNIVHDKPLTIVLRHPDGSTSTIQLKAGAVYPLHDEFKDVL